MHLKIKKGLDIPLAGSPPQKILSISTPKTISLNLGAFPEVNSKLLAKKGDRVKIGTPLVENKSIPGQFFVAPGAGEIIEVRRGLKRKLLDIVIALDPEEDYEKNGGFAFKSASREELCTYLLKSGIFPHIRRRPFDFIADPQHIPRDIFVRAVESLPYLPSAEMLVEGEEESFQIGLDVLQKMTSGKVHLVYKSDSQAVAFLQAQGVEKHTISGPHPIGSASLHIHYIQPICHLEDYVWTLNVPDVITVGKMVATGHYPTDHLLSLAGEGWDPQERGYVKARRGFPVAHLIENRLLDLPLSLISGDPLTGTKVESSDYLHFYDHGLSAIADNITREFLHFFRLGKRKYSFHPAYYTGHAKLPSSGYHFTTNRHGEERPFIDAEVYDKVMPLKIPVAPLVKAILAEDFDLAVQLGLLEVTAADFALATFICPSKIEMVEIVEEGIKKYAKEMGLFGSFA